VAIETAPVLSQRRDRPLGTVLVTGAASGLGAAVTRAIDAAGGTPIALDRAPVEDVESVVVDLADSAAARAAVHPIAARGLDGVVTAAGVDVPGPFDEVDPEEWERVVRVNLFGTAAVLRAAFGSLRERRGRIVTVASTLGHRAAGDASAYCASKAGVVGFTRALTAECKGDIGITLLTPGGMQTHFFDGRTPQYQPAPGTPLCDPHDVADAVVFALSRPEGCEVKELVVAGPYESSWP
jgi:NAD(P)-dependent dehydrogenase (short-subunit alcohol dehydrogenase family)